MNNHVYADLIAQSIKNFDSLPCLHVKRRGSYTTWSYRQFGEEVGKASVACTSCGLKKGENAVVIGENSPEWIIAYHAIIFSGACTVPIDPNIPPSEIATIVVTTRARIVFCSQLFLPYFRSLQKKHSFIKMVVVLEPLAPYPEVCLKQFIATSNIGQSMLAHRFEPDDPCIIIFTSGTTGKPKGVVITQKNLVAVSLYGIQRMNLTSSDTVCAVLPLHHVFGFAACVVAGLSAGMDIVCVPEMKGASILAALNDKGVTFLPAVPKMLQLFYDNIENRVREKGVVTRTLFSALRAISRELRAPATIPLKRKLFSSVHRGFGGKLRLIISGGASLDKKYWEGFQRLGFTIVEGYGLSETFGPITVCPGGQPRLGSVGPVLPENELAIAEPNAQGIGEVLLKGICVFKEYYKNSALSKELFDREGWFHTGDLGRVDSNGYLYLSGRAKDTIVLGNGKNVYPDELESHYSKSSFIEEVGVLGTSIGNGDTIVAAVIVPKKRIKQSKSTAQTELLIKEDIMRLGKSLPAYRRIRDFVIVQTALPRTTTRKIIKGELTILYTNLKRTGQKQYKPTEELTVAESAIMETALYKKLVEGLSVAVEKLDPDTVTPRSYLEFDLGLDSLDRVELSGFIEQKLLITVPIEQLEQVETVAQLYALLTDH